MIKLDLLIKVFRESPIGVKVVFWVIIVLLLVFIFYLAPAYIKELYRDLHVNIRTRIVDNPTFLYIRNKELREINLAVLLDVVSIDNKPTGIKTYSAEIMVGKKWYKLKPVSFLERENLFVSDKGNLKSCTEISLKENFVSVSAKDKVLSKGDSVVGWVFFEYPEEIVLAISKGAAIEKINIHLVSYHSSADVAAELSGRVDGETGEDQYLKGAVLKIIRKNVDLSNYKIGGIAG